MMIVDSLKHVMTPGKCSDPGKPLMTMRTVAAEHYEMRDSAAGQRGAKTIDHSVRTLITVIND